MYRVAEQEESKDSDNALRRNLARSVRSSRTRAARRRRTIQQEDIMGQLGTWGLFVAPPGREPLPDAVGNEGESIVKVYGSRAVPAFKVVIHEGAREMANFTITGDSFDALADAIRQVSCADAIRDLIKGRDGVHVLSH